MEKYISIYIPKLEIEKRYFLTVTSLCLFIPMTDYSSYADIIALDIRRYLKNVTAF